MPLQYVTKTVYEVDYSDLDAFIEEVYGHPFETAAALESSNDVAHTFSFTKEKLKYRWDIEQLAIYKTVGKYQSGDGTLRLLMQDMVNQGLIPEGNYVIEVSW